MNTRPLPPPIKPRVLKKAKTFDGYVTSDGRYEARPARYGTNRRVRFWEVTEPGKVPPSGPAPDPRLFPSLEELRRALCAPGGKIPWLVCDMDDGVLRVEPTRAAAAEWRTYFDDDLFVVRADRAESQGWDPLQRPYYPHPDDPFERVDIPAPAAGRKGENG
ncbi:hypothetical protein [Streptomyces albidoflavus]|uniref:hypothetical protein n=1 Tax=Streptomyces albidoflavus TaxID=1886 RepID=UPI0033D5F522